MGAMSFAARRRLVSTLLIGSLGLAGCADKMTADGVTYVPYGLANQDEKDPRVQYEICVGNVIWAVILSETVVAPIYFFGWSLYEPVGLKRLARTPAK
jgi:hypothetical protein